MELFIAKPTIRRYCSSSEPLLISVLSGCFQPLFQHLRRNSRIQPICRDVDFVPVSLGDQRVRFLLGLSLKPEPAECARGLRGRPMTGMPTRVTFRVAGFPSIAFPLA